MEIKYSEFTSAGLVRANNQDSLLAVKKDNYGLFVVADGMGGHYGGEIASGRLVEALKQWWEDFSENPIKFDNCADVLKALITAVNASIYNEFSKEGKICGTTVALLLLYDDKYLVINAGDSRVYSRRGHKVTQESVDHVFGTEAKIEGKLTDEEISEHRNKNKLTSAVGCKEQFKMSVKSAPLTDGSFFICSDGVYKYCNEKNINSFLACPDSEKLEKQVQSIVEGNGANDNFSYIKIIVGKDNASGFMAAAITKISGFNKITVAAISVVCGSVIGAAIMSAIPHGQQVLPDDPVTAAETQSDTEVTETESATEQKTETLPSTETTTSTDEGPAETEEITESSTEITVSSTGDVETDAVESPVSEPVIVINIEERAIIKNDAVSMPKIAVLYNDVKLNDNDFTYSISPSEYDNTYVISIFGKDEYVEINHEQSESIYVIFPDYNDLLNYYDDNSKLPNGLTFVEGSNTIAEIADSSGNIFMLSISIEPVNSQPEA